MAGQTHPLHRLRRALGRLARLSTDSSSHLDTVGLIETLTTTAYADWLKERGDAAQEVSLTDSDEFEAALWRAMAGSALADGVIDADERQKLQSEFESVGLPHSARETMLHELLAPASAEAVARAATTPQQAAAIYLAALLPIEPDTAAEDTYLARLARLMRLDPGLVAHLHRAVHESLRH